jgi:sugar lactone lactonase YvrE
MISGPAPVADLVAIVGESPIWSPDEQALYWIDGLRPHLIRLDHNTGAVRVRALPYRPGCIARLPDGRLLIVYKKGLGAFDFESAVNTALPAAGVGLRDVSFNDGACDRRGRFWIGTRHREASAPEGALYRIGIAMMIDRMVDGLIVSNGIAFSPDGGTMYHTDSRPGRIDAYDYDQDSGALGRRRVLLNYAGRGFRPDGCTVDAEGFLWVAEIDGARISRYAPSGDQLRTDPGAAHGGTLGRHASGDGDRHSRPARADYSRPRSIISRAVCSGSSGTDSPDRTSSSRPRDVHDWRRK